MNKKILVGIVLIVLLLLGGGYYFMSHKTTAQPATTKTEKTTAAPSPTSSQTIGTLKNLMTSGTSQTCSYSSQRQASTSGTIYMSGGKLRGDFTSVTSGQNVNGHMIINSGYSYVWTDLMKTGMKIKITEAEPTGTPSSQGVDLNESVSYTCKPWTADESKFSLPSDITFREFTVGATTPAAGTTGANGATSACSACDSLPAAAQTACKTQLHCQ